MFEYSTEIVEGSLISEIDNCIDGTSITSMNFGSHGKEERKKRRSKVKRKTVNLIEKTPVISIVE